MCYRFFLFFGNRLTVDGNEMNEHTQRYHFFRFVSYLDIKSMLNLQLKSI